VGQVEDIPEDGREKRCDSVECFKVLLRDVRTPHGVAPQRTAVADIGEDIRVQKTQRRGGGKDIVSGDGGRRHVEAPADGEEGFRLDVVEKASRVGKNETEVLVFTHESDWADCHFEPVDLGVEGEAHVRGVGGEIR
jgi:hypothetical protein